MYIKHTCYIRQHRYNIWRENLALNTAERRETKSADMTFLKRVYEHSLYDNVHNDKIQ